MGSGDIASLFLTSALDGGKWLTWRPDRFNPGERAPVTHWTGSWVSPNVGLNDKSLCPAGNRTPAVQPAARRYTGWAGYTQQDINELYLRLIYYVSVY
jgi:hypothetical protein